MNFQVHNATGAGAISKTITPGTPFLLHQISVHLSAAGAAGNLTLNSDDNLGAAYDINMITQDMTSIVDFIQTFDPPIRFTQGDQLVIAWANGSGRTYGLKVITEVC
jgi:hypothetical protein